MGETQVYLPLSFKAPRIRHESIDSRDLLAIFVVLVGSVATIIVTSAELDAYSSLSNLFVLDVFRFGEQQEQRQRRLGVSYDPFIVIFFAIIFFAIACYLMLLDLLRRSDEPSGWIVNGVRDDLPIAYVVNENPLDLPLVEVDTLDLPLKDLPIVNVHIEEIVEQERRRTFVKDGKLDD